MSGPLTYPVAHGNSDTAQTKTLGHHRRLHVSSHGYRPTVWAE